MSRGNGSTVEDEGNSSFRSLEITPAPYSFPPQPNDYSQSPETPHRHLHSRQRSESRQLLPEPKEIFKYSTTVYFNPASPSGHRSVIEEPYSKWSDEPKTLTPSGREVVSDLVADLVVVIIPFCFYALAGTMIYVSGNTPKEYQEAWFKQSTWVASTLFPLVFSFIVGRSAIRLSSYKIERGTSLGFLESLMGSRTFFSTLITQFRLHASAPLSLCLIFIWLLSPFGSQAILRSLSLRTKIEDSKTNVTYFNTRQAAASDTGSWSPVFVTASILAPQQVKNSSVDLWGNVKIPLLSSFANTSSPDSDGWYTVPQLVSEYTSLFGIPIALPNGNSTIFLLKSSHLELSCHTISSNSVRINGTFHNPGLIAPSGPLLSSETITNETSWAIGYLGTDTSPLLPPALSKTPSLDAVSDKVQVGDEFSGLLLYQDFTGYQNVTSIYCTPSQTYIESEITCLGKNCRVTSMRSLKEEHPPPRLTMLSFRSIFLAVSSLILLSTPKNSTLSPRGQVDFLQNYLVKPDDNDFIQTALPPASLNEESRFLKLPLVEFEARLGAVINSILQGSQGSLGSLLDGGSLSSKVGDSTTSTVVAQTAIHSVVFTINWPWLSVLLLATTIMLLSAIASAILHRKTLARDYLGFISSLARESRYARIPTGGANIDGLRRSKILGKLKIKLGDVGDVQEGWQIGLGAALSVGMLGIGTGDSVASLDKRKLYV